MIWKCHDLHSFLWPSLKAAFDLAPSTAQLTRLKGLMKLNQSAMEHVRCCLDHHDWIWQPGWRVWFDHWDLGFHSPTRVQTTWNIRHESSTANANQRPQWYRFHQVPIPSKVLAIKVWWNMAIKPHLYCLFQVEGAVLRPGPSKKGFFRSDPKIWGCFKV